MNAQVRTYTEMLGAGLNSLPDEVLLEILTLVVETQRTSLVALELSQVCKRFRRVVLGSPMVWSNIHPASHSHRMVSIYAERNRSLGLNVTLTLTNKHILPQLQFLKAVVSAQAHWRSLSIEGGNSRCRGPVRFVERASRKHTTSQAKASLQYSLEILLSTFQRRRNKSRRHSSLFTTSQKFDQHRNNGPRS